MDAGSILVLVIVAALLVLAARYMLKKREGCLGCKDEGCAFHGTDHEMPEGETLINGKPVSCPVAERAIASVEERLGPVEEPDQ